MYRFKRLFWRPEILIFFVTFAVFAQSLGNIFVAFDDELLILTNPYVQGLTWANIAHAFSSYDPELYIPLTLLTYQLEYTLFGYEPMVYHLTSLLIHIVGSVLLFQIFTHFFSRRIALVCALLFALHPVNVEVVSWASSRKDVLSAMLFLFSVWSYLSNRRVLSITAFALGLLAKVSIAPLPFVLLALDWVQGRRIDRHILMEKIPYLVLSGVFIVIAILGKSQVSDISIWSKLAFIVFPFHLGKYLLPIQLSIFYPFIDAVSFVHPAVLGGLIVTIILTVIAALSIRYTRWIAFAFAWYVLLIGPSFLTVIKGGEDGSVALYYGSDRYVYLAGISILFLVGWLLAFVERRTHVWQWVMGVLICLFGFLTYRQSLVWRDSVSLFAPVIAQERPAFAAYRIMADIYAERGQLENAAELYRHSIAIQPTSRAYLNLANVAAIQGDQQTAIDVLSKVLEIDPSVAQVHIDLGNLFVSVGKLEEAASSFERAIEINNYLTEAHFNLGVVYEYLDRPADARREFERVLELNPGDEQVLQRL